MFNCGGDGGNCSGTDNNCYWNEEEDDEDDFRRRDRQDGFNFYFEENKYDQRTRDYQEPDEGEEKFDE